ncbi:MAG: hypothetical protein FJ276_26340 [Planctomycetes bacterium]|nr:hypothetical protein [Planctomycetota bacterium]
MELKGLMSGMGMNGFALVGLAISFVAFLAILVWIWSRPQKEIDAQAWLFADDEAARAEDPLSTRGTRARSSRTGDGRATSRPNSLG